eukprot:3777435-Prymnesium_polylepis.1
MYETNVICAGGRGPRRMRPGPGVRDPGARRERASRPGRSGAARRPEPETAFAFSRPTSDRDN